MKVLAGSILVKASNTCRSYTSHTSQKHSHPTDVSGFLRPSGNSEIVSGMALDTGMTDFRNIKPPRWLISKLTMGEGEGRGRVKLKLNKRKVGGRYSTHTHTHTLFLFLCVCVCVCGKLSYPSVFKCISEIVKCFLSMKHEQRYGSIFVPLARTKETG